MNPSRLISALLLLMLGCLCSHAQELNCQVEVNADQISNTNREVFKTLEQAMREYVNTNTFTNVQLSPNEKIECKLFLTVKEYADDKIVGDLQIQSTRPVYNSDYTTTLINFKDNKIEFTYRENEPLIFSVNNMESQLTAILNYYVYLILAIDFDSFSPRGGEPWFERLKKIVQMGQSSGETGWKAFEDTKNRAAVLSAFTDGQNAQLRDLIYNYHRKGLDEMAQAPEKGRANITASLQNLQKVYQFNPMSVGLSMIRDAKMDELVNVYSRAPLEERNKVVNILSEIYPTENQRIDQIKNPPEN